jgi:hypothetical protein
VNPRLAPARAGWPRACDGEWSRQVAKPRNAAEKEHTMIAAFALALVAVAVLGSLNIAASAR